MQENFEDYVLYVDDLSIEYTLGRQHIYALSHFTLGIKQNESIGIVGESGCGKSTLALAISHILPQNASVTSGRVYFKGKVIVDASMGASFSLRYSAKERKIEDQLKLVRWKGISVIFQGALDSLNPLQKVGSQLSDIFIYKEEYSPEHAEEESKKLLTAVGLEEWVYDVFPHQLSGGMKQRVMIAMAISLKPSLIISDEPTTSLDVITQYRIIEELMKLKETYGVALLSISHDVSMISRLSNRIVVMYAGRMVEKLPFSYFDEAAHPYTHMLVSSIPKIDEDVSEILPISGSPPRLLEPIVGCPFYERCNYRADACLNEEATNLVQVGPNHEAACAVLPIFAKSRQAGPSSSQAPVSLSESDHVLEAINLTKVFQKRAGIREMIKSETNEIVAVDDVHLSVSEGETVALVGETGSGKTTLSRMLGLLEIPTSGKVKIDGQVVDLENKDMVRNLRRTVQTIFQDPFQSVNPRFSVFEAVEEPLKVNKFRSADETDSTNTMASGFSQLLNGLQGSQGHEQLVKAALEDAELTPPEDFLEKYPHQLSGGQRQRVSIARGLILNPKILIADEPISMLDVSLRAGVLNLLKKLRAEHRISILYITHDIASARYLADRIYVMYRGEIVESGNTEELIRKSAHPYTVALLLASIGLEGTVSETLGEKIFVQSMENENPTGCRFAPRCQFAKEICTTTKPELQKIDSGHTSRCHFASAVQGMKLTAVASRSRS